MFVCVSWLSLDWMDICLILKDYCKCAVTESFCLLHCNLSVLCILLFVLFYIWDNLRIMCSLSGHLLAWAKTVPWYKATPYAEVPRCTEITVRVFYPVCCDTKAQDSLYKILQEFEKLQEKLQEKEVCAPFLSKSVTSMDDYSRPCDCETNAMYTYLFKICFYTVSTVFYPHSFHFL